MTEETSGASAHGYRVLARKYRPRTFADLIGQEAVVRTHIRHALIFVDMLEEIAPPPRAVTLYLDQLEVSAVRARCPPRRRRECAFWCA